MNLDLVLQSFFVFEVLSLSYCERILDTLHSFLNNQKRISLNDEMQIEFYLFQNIDYSCDINIYILPFLHHNRKENNI